MDISGCGELGVELLRMGRGEWEVEGQESHTVHTSALFARITPLCPPRPVVLQNLP